MDQTFDNGLRASTYELETSTVNVMDKSYEYNNDGSLKLVEDNLNWKFDRSYTYDHQTRLKDGKSRNSRVRPAILRFSEDTRGQTPKKKIKAKG